MAFIPLYDRVLIKVEVETEVKRNGILIPDTISEQYNKGTVVAVGAGLYDSGVLVPLTVIPGDRVLVPRNIVRNISLDGEVFLLLQEREIYGVIRDE